MQPFTNVLQDRSSYKFLNIICLESWFCFNIKEEYVSKIVKTWLPELANVFAKQIIGPEREALQENLPTCFSSFKNCV